MEEDLDDLRRNIIAEAEGTKADFDLFLLAFWDHLEEVGNSKAFYRLDNEWWVAEAQGYRPAMYKKSPGKPSMITVDGWSREPPFGPAPTPKIAKELLKRPAEALTRPWREFPYLWQGWDGKGHYWKVSSQLDTSPRAGGKTLDLQARNKYMKNFRKDSVASLDATSTELQDSNARFLEALRRDAPRNSKQHHRRLTVWQLGPRGEGIWIDRQPPERMIELAGRATSCLAMAEISITRHPIGKNAISILYRSGYSDDKYAILREEVLELTEGRQVETSISETHGPGPAPHSSADTATRAPGQRTKSIARGAPSPRTVMLEKLGPEANKANLAFIAEKLRELASSEGVSATSYNVWWWSISSMGTVFIIRDIRNFNVADYRRRLQRGGVEWNPDDHSSLIEIYKSKGVLTLKVDPSSPMKQKIRAYITQLLGDAGKNKRVKIC